MFKVTPSFAVFKTKIAVLLTSTVTSVKGVEQTSLWATKVIQRHFEMFPKAGAQLRFYGTVTCVKLNHDHHLAFQRYPPVN